MKQEQHPILQALQDYFDNTPKEQLEKDWEELEQYNHDGPEMLEILDSARENFMMNAKMYSSENPDDNAFCIPKENNKMKTFKDIRVNDSIFRYNIDDRVPFERYKVTSVEQYMRVFSYDNEAEFIRIIAANNNNEELKLEIPICFIDDWIYHNSTDGYMYISDLEEVITTERTNKEKLKSDFYNNINRCNRNIEYAEKFLQGLDETFTNKPTNIQTGDKIRFLESGNEYIVLKVKEDGALYVAKYFNGIRHLDVRPEELKDIERVF